MFYFPILFILLGAVAYLVWRLAGLQRELAEVRGQHETMTRGQIQDQSDIARKEEMLQVAASAMHNIGNALTVAKLATSDLSERCSDDHLQAFDLVLDDMLPEIGRHVGAGDIQPFLQDDPEGGQYLRSIAELVHHMREAFRKQQESADALSRKLNHISQIIELQQRLASGMGTKEIVGIETVIDDAALILAESAERRHVTIERDYGHTAPVRIDCLILTQVFINLLKNAIQALESRNDDRMVLIHTVSTERGKGKRVICTVSDNGGGISEELLETIFSFGFTTRSERGGSGVGLHFCRRSVERHGGTLTAGNGREGAIFTLELPAFERQPVPEAPARTETMMRPIT